VADAAIGSRYGRGKTGRPAAFASMDAPRPARIFFHRGFAPVSAVAIYPAFNDEPVTWPW
jgi:hypothetical protein